MLAGFWIRGAAYLLDNVFLVVVGLFMALGFDNEPVKGAAGEISPIQFVNMAIGTLYMVIGWSAFGTTLGGRIFNVYVVRTDGSTPGAARALLRYLATILSVLTLGFGYLMIALRPDKRSLHDLVADTYVVIKKTGT